jgi:DNA (cytosine-5)-methyltransferase 1
MLASRCCDPADVLFVDEQLPPPCRTALDTHAHGFYWTEGVRGLGWAEDAIPTLKNGSTIGIPSPPAILLPSGKIITPDIRDAERLQGLPENWTEPAEAVARPSSRWTLVGNAVTVDVANWIGNRLSMPGQFDRSRTRALPSNGRWPRAARGDGRERVMVEVTDYPEWRAREPLHQFLDHGGRPLSLRAATGFRSRTKRSRLRFPQGFLAVLDGYIDQIECGSLSSLPAPSSAPTPMVAA